MMLTIERLKEVLDYDSEIGIFTWKINRRRCRRNAIAGTITPKGYIKVQIDKQIHSAHRLAWLYMTEKWPEDEIDHRNGNKADNRWINLREADRFLNNQNQTKAQKHNKSGLLGVSIRKYSFTNPWHASISINRKIKHLGNFPTPQEAHNAYLCAKRKLHTGCTI